MYESSDGVILLFWFIVAVEVEVELEVDVVDSFKIAEDKAAFSFEICDS